MKKILITMSLFSMTFLFSSSIIGQFSGSLYYGAPNILSSGIETSNDYIFEVSETESDVAWSNFGPVGLNIAYVTDGEISFGLDLNYSQCSGNFDYKYDLSTSTYEHTMDINRTIFRAMFRTDANFGKGDVFKPYVGVGVGYRASSNTFESTRVGFAPSEDINFPLAFRAHAGANIFFSYKMGILIEAGLFGGGLVRFGLTYKM
tara:strand:+ start:83 stop:694 length:612 start_codon:yes stop_codon:yes gene_type:complete